MRLITLGILFFLCNISLSFGQDISTAPMAIDLNSRSSNWWETYQIHPCTTAVIRTPITNGLAYNEVNGCTLYVDSGLWDKAQGWPLTQYLEAKRQELCKVWFHERGHSGGLFHWNGWVMDGRGLAFIPTIGECNKFARGE